MMRLLVCVFLVAVSVPVSSVIGAGGRGEFCCDNNQCSGHAVACQEGLSCCYQRPVWMESIGGTCYDPKTETCANCPVYNPNHPQTQVCPSTSPTCCGDCINSTLQCCHNDGSYNFFTCEAGKTCCGFSGSGTCCGFSGSGTCCDSNQDCINDVCVTKQAATTAPTPAPGCVIPGDLKCGNRCYNPSTHVCTNAATEFLCPVAYPNQCDTLCYSSTQYSCENGQLKPVGSGPGATTQPPSTTTQPPSTTTAPTAAPTAAPGCVIPGDLKCGSRCYNPSTHVCANAGTEFLCPVDFPNACDTLCYSKNQYSCENRQLKPVGPGVTQPPSTTTQPPSTTTAPTAAPGCVLPGDLRCGNRCYNPSTHVCADAGSNFLCPTAFPSKCGDACYSPDQYRCENGQLKGL